MVYLLIISQNLFGFNLFVVKNKSLTERSSIRLLYRAAKKDITRKSLRYKGFRRFLMHFSLLLRDLNKTTGILLSAKKDITSFSSAVVRLV